jgi:uncharacterized protein (DUF58 family)
LTYALILLGVATLSQKLIILAFPLALYLAATLVYRPGPLNLTFKRTVDNDLVAPDAPVTVELTVTNDGGDLDEVTISDLVPPGLQVTGPSKLTISLPGGSTHTFTYKVRGPRGAYRFRGASVVAHDHLGLFRRRQHYPLLTKLAVLPNMPELRRVLIRPLRTRGYAGPIPSRQGGSGTDFFGVRAYNPGDPPRWINWRLSARHPHDLFTNEFEQERIADVGLILDARERTNVDVDGESLFEHAVEATAALAGTFLDDGNRVGLLIYGRGVERTFPGYGKHQRQRILRALSQARTGESQVFDSLDYLPTRFFPAKCQIVLISPLCEDDPQVLTRLRARGYEVLVVSPNPVDFEAQVLPPHPAKNLATRIAQTQRTLWIRKLQRVGIAVVDWRVDRPLDTVIHATLKTAAPQIHRRVI